MATKKKATKKAVKSRTRKSTKKTETPRVQRAGEKDPKLVTAVVAFAVAYGHDVKIPSNATIWVGNQESLLPIRFIPTDTENLQAVVDGLKRDLQNLTDQSLSA
ncbi:MAG: hypothetical protein GF334_03435 [Candidatus Altiarchaeales archaeon]|nr:hypothetical protein [Candidatus Altiarchaeales archaeon]